ncbi:MAG: hypothetical protein ACKO8U_08015 [Pirellula sp.]
MEFGTNTGKAESIRKRFGDWVRDRTGLELSHSMFETTLLQGGSYVGRRFSTMGFSLLWLIDQGRVNLIGPDGASLGSEEIDDFCRTSELAQSDPGRDLSGELSKDS